MKSHAKASSAGSTSSRGNGLGSLRRGALATRASSLGADGRGAPSARGKLAVLSAAACVFVALVLTVGSAFAAKNVNTWIGSNSSGSLGAQFNNPAAGVAVNASTGDIYVADTSNNRIQQFSSAGAFIRAWGFDVIQSGKPGDLGTNVFEACTTASDCKAGIASTVGGFNPGGELSSPWGIAIDQSDGSVYVTDQDFRRVQKFSSSGVFQRAFGQDVVQTGKAGDAPATSAKQNLLVDAAGGHFTLTFKGQTTGDLALAYNDSPATIQAALQGLSTIGSSNVTVTGGADCTATCTITFAGALANSPQPLIVGASSTGDALTGGTTSTATVTNNTTGSSGFEVCTTAADCQTGASASTAGAFLSTFNGYIAVAPAGSPNAGRVVVADPANRRVQEFSSAGAFVDAFGFDVAKSPTGTGTSFEVCSAAGSDVCQQGAAAGTGNGQFANNSPNRVAVDDAGRIYAVDNNNSRIERFSSAPAFDTLYATTLASGSPAPTDIAIDPGATAAGNGADDHVFVVKPFNAGTGTPPATAAERRILELDTTANPASALDTHMVNAGINSVNGIGMNTANDRLYVSSTTGGNRVYFLDNPLPSPALVVNSIITKTDTTTTFTGTIDPQGGNVSNCKFQYSTDPGFSGATDVAVPACDTLAIGGGAQAVSASVTGLTPNTHYYVRLQASRPFVANSTATSFTQSFDTNSVPPVVSDVGSVDVQDTSARLVGTIDPKHSATGYVFQYGTTPSLGSSTAPVAIGAGTTPITVSQVVGGLDKDTTYYFRVVATNAFGTTNSTQATLHTRVDPLPLPDDRGYEMVTPIDKNFSDSDNTLATYQRGQADASPDGNAVAYCAFGLFGDPAGQLSRFCSPYFSRRTPTGWEMGAAPRYCHTDPATGGDASIGGILQAFVSPDFSHIAFNIPEIASCPFSPYDPAASLTPGVWSHNFYRGDFFTDPHDFDLLSPSNTGAINLGESGPPVLGSADFSHIVYQSTANQTAPPDSPPANSTLRKLYDWHNGALTLVSKDTAGNPFTTSSSLVTRSSSGNSYVPSRAVSDSGDRIFFQNPTTSSTGSGNCIAGCDIYMRENATTTFDLSTSECTASCPPASVSETFLWASKTGDKAFFTSTAKLTDTTSTTFNGAPSALYRWDRNGASGHKLTLLNPDNEPSDGTDAGFQSLIGTSDDGDTVYFTTQGQIVPGGPTFPATVSGGVWSGLKLYRWRWNGGNPAIDYIGPYNALADAGGGASTAGGGGTDFSGSMLNRMVTPDGGYMMLYTRLAYDPAVDRDADADLYRWDATDGWTCVSCQLPGAPSAGGVDLNMGTFTQAFQLRDSEQRIAMSDDGQRIFFGTPDALVPEDVNGSASCPSVPAHPPVPACQDVYEWHDGRVSLLSTGTGANPAWLIDATPNGRDAFIFTRDHLVGWDKDDQTDIFDARIGGGFPEPPAQPPACEGDACRGAGSVPSSIPGAGSAAFQGPGDPQPKHAKAKKKHHKHKKKHHKRAHRRAANHNRRTGR